MTHPLGRRPANPDKPRLRLNRFLKTVPAHPVVSPPPDLQWPMDLNDVYGDCVVAGVDHSLQAIAAAFGEPRANWTNEQILELYKTQNPGLVPGNGPHGAGSQDDGGMIVQDFLAECVKRGLILGFASFDPTDQQQREAAEYLFLAVVTGEDLRVAQQSQRVWDYVPNSVDWGGHCTTWVGYGGGRSICVSWGEAVPMTESFIDHQVEEAWVILTEAHLRHPDFRAGFDLTKFAAAYETLTGRPFPAPLPPEPTPVPPPVSPGAAPFPGASLAVSARLGARAAKRGMTTDQYQEWFWRGEFRLPR